MLIALYDNAFLLMIDSYFLIAAVNGQIFNPAAKLAISTAKPTNDANTDVES